MAIPEACRSYFNGTTTYLQSLETGDIKAAMARRDKLEPEVRALFARVKTGEVIGTGEELAELRGALSRAAITEALAEGREALEDAVWAAEAEADRLRGKARERFTRAIAGDHPIDHYLDAYLSAIKLAAKTTNERRGLINRFARWCIGEKYRLPDITRKAAGRYVTEIIEPMDRSTAKKHMTALRGYWEYLIKRGHVSGTAEDNPWLGQEVANGRRRIERGDNESERPFTEVELKTLLYAPYPKGMSEGFRQQIADALRISCLSGMRLAEVLTLWVEEVHDGIFDIQQGKTRSAARKVPIHPDLNEVIARRLKDKQPRTGYSMSWPASATPATPSASASITTAKSSVWTTNGPVSGGASSTSTLHGVGSSLRLGMRASPSRPLRTWSVTCPIERRTSRSGSTLRERPRSR
ncbi:tyrosine-type recombinase/integrase [Rhizobium leguminosarum]|uniref:tyrosine-type recombinase/integrase n=1 Tax=Rhizobium leguminosarum TaxID=384 RepID=UPI001FF035CB|nr:hypothetical protein [Rhizobium leguminosarum]